MNLILTSPSFFLNQHWMNKYMILCYQRSTLFGKSHCINSHSISEFFTLHANIVIFMPSYLQWYQVLQISHAAILIVNTFPHSPQEYLAVQGPR